jgi:L-seryl-tRNA(Ser) seleniumtransferase
VNPGHNLKELPAVHQLLDRLPAALARFPRALVLAEVRRVLDAERESIRGGHAPQPDTLSIRIEAALADLEHPSLRRVINATGVVLHTNLGRAPLAVSAIAPGYSNLEYDLATGRRGKRDAHARDLIERLTGAPGIVVNNNAAAVFLALHEIAAGGEVVVSRGELIEIGDGFRIPEIMGRSGAVLREVGTTNRTHVEDYRAAINERTRLLLRVHPSNFRITGFTSRPALHDLAALGRERGIPVYEDLGSGCMADLRPFGIEEPLVGESLAAGADLVSFSGDKLLGGPQAGILAGKAELVSRLRRNPLFRALRVDKLIYHALEDTLRNVLLERWEHIPAVAMIRQPAEEIYGRAEALLRRFPQIDAEILPGKSVIGGGSTPDQSLDTWLITPHCDSVTEAERLLRSGNPPVVARIEDERLVIDLRTVLREEEDDLGRRLQQVHAKAA